MINIFVSLHPDTENPGYGLVEYNIPELGKNAKFAYRLIPRKNVEAFLKIEDGHMKLDEAKFQKLLEREGEKFAIQVCLDLILLPTFYLNDPKYRVAIEHDSLVAFMQEVVDCYVETLRSPKRQLRWFRIGKRKSGNNELSLQCDVTNLVSRFQKVGIGICTRNPLGVCWDCLVPLI